MSKYHENPNFDRLYNSMKELEDAWRGRPDFSYYCGYVDALFMNDGVNGKDFLVTVRPENRPIYLMGRFDALGDLYD